MKRLAVVLSHPIQHFCPLYAAWADRSDWNIHVFFGSCAGAQPYFDARFGKTVAWPGLKLDRFTHTFLNGSEVVPISNRLDASSLDRELDDYRPDAVLTYGYNQALQRRAQRWASRRKIPLVFFSDGELRHARPVWARMAKRMILPSLLDRISWFIVTGNANEEYYRHYGVPAWKMIRGSYPIDREAYEGAYRSRSDLRSAFRRKLGISEDELVVLVVGKLVAWKRQCDVIEAVGLLQGVRAVSLIVGDGEKLHEWQEFASQQKCNRTIFPGFTSPDDLPGMYAAADVYVHASEKEPHSVAVSEAIFMGLPVVISDRCGSYGMDDDVRCGINGAVYRCGAVHELAGCLRRVLRDEKTRRAMAEASRRIAVPQQQRTYEDVLSVLGFVIDLQASTRTAQ